MKDMSTDPQPSTHLTRDEILDMLSETNAHSKHRLLKGRVKDRVLERIKQGWATVTINGLKVYLAGLKDAQLDEIEGRIEALENKDDNDKGS